MLVRVLIFRPDTRLLLFHLLGFYIPYIATRIVDASAAEKAALPLNLRGLLINDGVYCEF